MLMAVETKYDTKCCLAQQQLCQLLTRVYDAYHWLQ